MDNYNQSQSMAQSQSKVAFFMQQVYLWMCAALVVTAITAYYTANSMFMIRLIYSNGNIGPIILIVGIIGLVMYLSSQMHKLSSTTATSLFILYAGLNGVFLAPILLAYTGASIAQTFIITAGMFGGMSVYGMVTKKDLSSWGSFLIMGLWGLILASLVNLFFKSGTASFVISIVGIIVFVGLTAYDTQKIKEMGETAPIDDAVAIRRGALLGAITLYLDFINIFLYMLRLFGDRR